MFDLILNTLTLGLLLIRWLIFLASFCLIIWFIYGLFFGEDTDDWTVCFVAVFLPPLCIIFLLSTPSVLSWSKNKILDNQNPNISYIDRNNYTNQEIKDLNLEEKPFYKIIGFSKIPAKNCVGSNSIETKVSATRTFNKGYKINYSGDLNLNLIQQLGARISAQYELNEGEILTSKIDIGVTAEPKSNTVYQYVWKEVWYNGYALVKNNDGKEFTIPFSLIENLEHEQTSADDIGCSENIS